MVIDQSGIVRYRGGGVLASVITYWIDDLLTTDFHYVPQKTPHLYQNYPNPFNPGTNISFDLPEKAKVVLQIFDLEGKLIKTLVDDQMAEGPYTFSWNGVNNSGQPVASGIYYYVLKTDTGSQMAKRMILMR